ncbi:hypothetical protein G3598_002960 [Listeria monocytogenes]|nr:hypothetical protein [Listeria monocytogenes]
MENPEKSTGLFMATDDYVDEEMVNKMKNLFAEAQKIKAHYGKMFSPYLCYQVKLS